jgi:hypothetical protein
MRRKRKTWEKKKQEEEEDDDEDETGPQERRGRSEYINQEKIDKLDSVGFTWSFDLGHKTWKERYQDLIAFKEEHGHCNVPYNDGTFGDWVRWLCHNNILLAMNIVLMSTFSSS